MFHLPGTWIRSDTLIFSFIPCVIGRKDGGLGIHGFLKAFVSCPIPIHFLSPLVSNFFSQPILLHVRDRQLPSFDNKKDVFVKYLACRICEMRDFGFTKILYACFASSAWLYWTKFLKPSPRSLFGILVCFEALQWILCLEWQDPHQYRAINFSISSYCASRILKQYIKYVGMAWMAAFRSIFFPACENNSPPNEFNRTHILSFMDLKSTFLFSPLHWQT